MTNDSQKLKTVETSIAPMLSVRNGAKAIDFYKAAFGATELFRLDDQSGAVVAQLSVNEADFWLADESPENLNFSPESLGGGSVRMVLTVENPDAAFNRAIAAGAKMVWPVADQYGWRIGGVVDPNGGYAVIPYAVYTITATLVSDGDLPLDFDGAAVTSSISGYITPSPGTATVSATTCSSSVPVGPTCSVTVSYDPTTIKCTSDAYGYAYTRIHLSLITDAGANIDFTQGFTVTGLPICED